MSNSRTRRVSYKPRYTDLEAFDLLPPELRKALWEGATTWDSSWFLRRYRKLARLHSHKNAVADCIAILDDANRKEVTTTSVWSSHRQRGDSPHVHAGATIQSSGLSECLS